MSRTIVVVQETATLEIIRLIVRQRQLREPYEQRDSCATRTIYGGSA